MASFPKRGSWGARTCPDNALRIWQSHESSVLRKKMRRKEALEHRRLGGNSLEPTIRMLKRHNSWMILEDNVHPYYQPSNRQKLAENWSWSVSKFCFVFFPSKKLNVWIIAFKRMCFTLTIDNEPRRRRQTKHENVIFDAEAVSRQYEGATTSKTERRHPTSEQLRW